MQWRYERLHQLPFMCLESPRSAFQVSLSLIGSGQAAIIAKVGYETVERISHPPSLTDTLSKYQESQRHQGSLPSTAYSKPLHFTKYESHFPVPHPQLLTRSSSTVPHEFLKWSKIDPDIDGCDIRRQGRRELI
jgi:hypothetical protein